MAQRTLKIALSSSLANPAAIASIWLDNQLIQENLTIPNNVSNPYILEHTFEASGVHTLKVTMLNDFCNVTTDLNLIVNYVKLSKEDGSYADYLYLANDTSTNNRTTDNQNLMLHTIWEAQESFELTFDFNNPVTWIDSYQYNLDYPNP